MYSLDGRAITVYDIQAHVYEKVGWLHAVDMYSLDGKSIKVVPYEVEAYKAVGWYTYVEYSYIKLKQQCDAYVASKMYNDAIELVEKYEKNFIDTGYEYSVGLLKENAMNAWRSSINCPIAVISYATGKDHGIPEVEIRFRNVSYKKIVAFRLTYDCYNIFGELEETYYTYYTVDSTNLDSCKSKAYTWELVFADSVHTIKNIRITDVVYADGTKW